MADKVRQFTTDKAMVADPSLRIVVSDHARANLEPRSISVPRLEHALRASQVERVDEQTGRVVYRLDKLGGLRVVTQRKGESVIVLTAMRPEEL